MPSTAKRIFLYSVIALLLVGGLGVGFLWWGTRIDRYPGLKDRLDAYYAFEARKDWKNTYSFRVPVYQRTVPFETYMHSMKRDSDGWKLVGYRILYVVPEKNRVKARIQFIETAPHSFLPQNLPIELQKKLENMEDLKFEMDDWSVWENIDGSWYAWETGSRVHLPLNEALAVPN